MRAARARVRSWLSDRRTRLDDRGSGARRGHHLRAGLPLPGGVRHRRRHVDLKRERAADIAEQAARFAAQDIDREALYDNEGGPAPINFENCDARVKAFAREMDMSGPDIAATHCVTATVDAVEVEVQLTYSPVFTGMFYGGDVVVHGQAVAENEVG